jgi:serine/threonine protein kinase
MAGTRKNRDTSSRTKRMVKGGRLIGKGAYGWAFMPPLACPEFTPVEGVKYISKTFVNDKKALEEYEKGITIKALDPEGLFFITPEAMCSYNDTQENANWGQFIAAKEKWSKATKGKDASSTQIIYKYGGSKIQNILVKNPPYVGTAINFSKEANWELLDPMRFGVFIKALKGFVPILDRLHTQFIHRDLHVGNMLYDEAGGVRLIDFGEAAALEGMKPKAAEKAKQDEYAMLIMIGWHTAGSRWGMKYFPKIFLPWLESVMAVIGNKKSTIDDYRALMLAMPEP